MALDKLVDSSQLDADLTSVANAIRAKSGGSGNLAFPAGFVSEIGGIETGDSATLITKSITANGTYSASDDDADGYSEVTVNVAGFNMDNLADNTWPSGEIAFSSSVTKIPAFCLAGRTGITRVSAPNATEIDGGAFMNCTGLTQITKDDFPNVTKITASTSPYGTFKGCTQLSVIHFPNLTTIPAAGIQWPSGDGRIGSSSVSPILVLPKVKTFPNLRAASSNVYAAIDLGPDMTTTAISGAAFFYEGYARVVIIRKSDAIIAASDTSCIRRVSSSWTFYVPQALLDTYKTATNWSTKVANGTTFLPIEGSIYETQYADGTPIE